MYGRGVYPWAEVIVAIDGAPGASWSDTECSRQWSPKTRILTKSTTNRRIREITNEVRSSRTPQVPKLVLASYLASFVVTVAGFVVTEPWFFFLWAPAFYILALAASIHLWRLPAGVVPKLIAVGVVVATVALVSIHVVFLTAPLYVEGTLPQTTYQSGASVEGIQWRPEFAEVRLILRNDTNKDYENLDVTISLNRAGIAVIKQTNNLDGVQIFNHNLPTLTSMSIKFDGKTISRPVNQSETQSNAINYRLRAEALPKNRGAIHIVIAAVTRHDSNAASGQRPTPTHVLIDGEYRAGMRTFSINKSFPLTTQ
jgi:hypothetical protein